MQWFEAGKNIGKHLSNIRKLGMASMEGQVSIKEIKKVEGKLQNVF